MSEKIRMTAAEALEHWTHAWSDIAAHIGFIRDVSRGNVLELGVRDGVSTCALLMGVKDRGGHVWSVDTDIRCAFRFSGDEDWTFVPTDSLDESSIRSAGLPEKIDVLFLDTTHTFEQVYAELKLWGPRVVENGIILIHDVITYAGAGTAMRRWAQENGLDCETRPGSNGLGIIYPKGERE